MGAHAEDFNDPFVTVNGTDDRSITKSHNHKL